MALAPVLYVCHSGLLEKLTWPLPLQVCVASYDGALGVWRCAGIRGCLHARRPSADGVVACTSFLLVVGLLLTVVLALAFVPRADHSQPQCSNDGC